MSYIPCSADCTFQKEGLCDLKYATVVGMPSPQSNACIHYIPRSGALRNARWHEAPPQYSAQGSAQDRLAPTDDPDAGWE